MSEKNIVKGFVDCLGIETFRYMVVEDAHFEIHKPDMITATHLLGCKTRLCKDAFENRVLYTGVFGVYAAPFDRDAVKRHWIAAKHRRDDAIGKKTEQQKADEFNGACIAMRFIGEVV